MKTTHYCLYKITNLLNEKIYIGIHKSTNLDDSYVGSGKLIKAAIKKYGIGNFKKEILETFSSEADMIAREIEVVTEEFCNRPDTYNLMPGGKFGSAKRNNLTFKGFVHSAQAKEKISKSSTGRTASAETRQKLSQNNFARRNPEKQKLHARLAAARPKSDEHKEKIRQRALITRSGVKNAGKKKPVVECPHCKKIGSVNTMSRWHFANCKQKKDGE